MWLVTHGSLFAAAFRRCRWKRLELALIRRWLLQFWATRSNALKDLQMGKGLKRKAFVEQAWRADNRAKPVRL